MGGWVRPPIPLDALAGDKFGDTGNGAMRRFKQGTAAEQMFEYLGVLHEFRQGCWKTEAVGSDA
jgi:hypothetical protein